MEGDQARRPPRAVDVAAAAGVSTATVSRAFNAPEKVARAVRERVHAAAAALSWTPHAAGSALAGRRSYIAGAVIPTLDNEIFAAQVGAMQSALAEQGVTLLLGCSDYDQERALAQVRVMLMRGVEALAIVGEAQKPELFDRSPLAAFPMSSPTAIARTALTPASDSTTAPPSIASPTFCWISAIATSA